MRNNIILTFVLLFAVNLTSRSANNAKITYIGNEGFMISNNDKKVFIDALYYYSYGAGILNVETAIRNEIAANEGQFSDADLFLITHDHPDHYNQSDMTKYLTNNPKAKLVASSSIINGITKTSLSEQLVAITPAQYQSIDTVVNSIPITVYNLIHAIGYRTYNVGYVADIDGLHIFHGGDNVFEDTLEYYGFNIKDKNIDVAFLSYGGFWRTPEQRDYVKRNINPKYIVLMHVTTTEIESIKETVNGITDSFAPIIVFNTSMESAILSDDTLIINNHMPKIINTVKDTTFNVNENITINLSGLFSDEDLEDSLSYSVTGLPDGFTFDSQTLTLTGSSMVALSNKAITVTVHDKNYCANSISFKMTATGSSGLDEAEQIENIIYPNPATDKLMIVNSYSENATIAIYNLQGKQEMSQKTGNEPVDISNLSKGIYIVRIIESGNIITNKFIKQ